MTRNRGQRDLSDPGSLAVLFLLSPLLLTLLPVLLLLLLLSSPQRVWNAVSSTVRRRL
jgi:hypothetical protein